MALLQAVWRAQQGLGSCLFGCLVSSLKPSVWVPSVCSWAGMKALCFLMLFSGSWQLHVEPAPSKARPGFDHFYSSHSLPCSNTCDCVALQPAHLSDTTENKPVLKSSFSTRLWSVLLCHCVSARFDARERKGKLLQGWEATGFGAGLPLAWHGLWHCTLIVCVPVYVVIMINSSGIYFAGQVGGV